MIRLLMGILLFVLGLHVMDLNTSVSMVVAGSVMIFISVGLIGLGIVEINKKKKRNN